MSEQIFGKFFGVSNLNISFLTSNIAFAFGLVVIVAISPITSSLLQYYETTKAKYSDEVTHLISFNKNGIWIKDEVLNNTNIINANLIEGNNLKEVIISQFDESFTPKKYIYADNINIKDILNPYFTTKKNGTGLGLSIVSKIINDHNGKIEFIPLDEGAKIKIDFIK